MLFIKELFETGRIRAVIARTYPLARIVEAHTHTSIKGTRRETS